jgi:hypothetical protein
MQMHAFARSFHNFPSIKWQSSHRSSYLPAVSIHWRVSAGLLFVLVVMSINARTHTTLTPLEQQTLLAFNPDAKAVTSVTLTGATTWTAGSLQDTGSVILKASVDGSSSETWSLASQPYSVANTSFTDGRTCNSVDSAAKIHQDASPACFRAAPWFAPWMSLLMLSNNVLLRTSGAHFTGGSESESQLQYMTNLGSTGTANASLAIVQSGTVIGLVIDPKTSLVDELDFNQSIDSDVSRVISYRIVFGDYRSDGGFVLPHHIQRYIQRTLQADITITNITAE